MSMTQRNEKKWNEMVARGSVGMKRIAYLFHGCIWHGHQECDNRKLEHRNVSSLDRYRMTILQEAAYKRAGYEMVRVWECEWRKMMDECTVRISHDDSSVEPTEELLKPYVNRICDGLANRQLIIGDALYEDRPENLVYHFPPTDADKIYYLDFTSLYPWVQKIQEFPVGVPEKLVGDKIPTLWRKI